jgi:hypothetical protein
LVEEESEKGKKQQRWELPKRPNNDNKKTTTRLASLYFFFAHTQHTFEYKTAQKKSEKER